MKNEYLVLLKEPEEGVAKAMFEASRVENPLRLEVIYGIKPLLLVTWKVNINGRTIDFNEVTLSTL